MNPVEDWLNRSWTDILRQTPRVVGNVRARVLAEMNRRHGRDELSAWLFYNAGFLLQTRNHRFGIDLSFPTELRESGEYRLDGLETLELLLVTHRHADHGFPELVGTLLRMNPSLSVVAPDEAAEELQAGGVDGNRVTVIAGGGRLELGPLTIEAETGDHLSENIADNLVYSVTTDGFTITHTGDNRDPSLTFRTDADLLLLSLYCEPDEEAPFTWGLPDLEAQARQVQRMRPRHVVPCHLNETGHAPNRAWRFLHAGLLKERLWLLEPHIHCHVLAPAERVTCERLGT